MPYQSKNFPPICSFLNCLKIFKYLFTYIFEGEGGWAREELDFESQIYVELLLVHIVYFFSRTFNELFIVYNVFCKYFREILTGSHFIVIKIDFDSSIPERFVNNFKALLSFIFYFELS